jgi:ATP synthase protein I
MASNTSPDDPGRTGTSSQEAELARRLEVLDRRLETIEGEREQEARKQDSREQGQSGLGQAFRLSTEFVAGVIVGGGLGWAIDRSFGISPWGMITFVMLGFAAGIFNAMRAAGFMRRPGSGR